MSSHRSPKYPLNQCAPGNSGQNASPMFATGFQPTISPAPNSVGHSLGCSEMGSQAPTFPITPFAQEQQLDSSSRRQNVFQSQPFPSTHQSSLLAFGAPPFPVPALVSASIKQPSPLLTSNSQRQEQLKPGHLPGCDAMGSQTSSLQNTQERQIDGSRYTTSKHQNGSQSQPFPSTHQSSLLALGGPPPFPVPAIMSTSTPPTATRMKQANSLPTSISRHQEQSPINVTGRSHATNESQTQQYDSNASGTPTMSSLASNIYHSPYVQSGVPHNSAPKSQTEVSHSAEVGVDQISDSPNSTVLPAAAAANDTTARRSDVLSSKSPRTSALDLTLANTSSKSSDVQTAKAEPEAQAGTSNDDMAIEMRKMISKLQEWRRKDPGLFSKVWDDLKKVFHLGFFPLHISDFSGCLLVGATVQ